MIKYVNLFKAFSSFDFKGTGYLEASDIYQDRISFKLPLQKDVSLLNHLNYLQEFEKFIKTQTIFKSKQKIGLNDFIKNFFID